ncbi:OLC1v1010418C1 [Oldenlandia corymbosa var. corymbosa]|uniref:OLC1v1010418C1 n=1 Tax=Oldenlandia corymbosa var. corymbosa TaxID=529605 RepID=A0AAV1DTP5_OLDCO|nr:OLC1v1010418C1 [Oldenlandia corymbosa var. corymbosa]
MDNLPKCQSNYAPLTPVNFLKRASSAYATRTSIIYGQVRFTWQETYERCRRLASSLKSLNLVKNNVVSVLAPNIPATYEMHFAVPMAGGVLNTINTRLDAKTIATILNHSEAKIFFVDFQYVPLASDALRLVATEFSNNKPIVIVIDNLGSPTGVQIGELEYEELVRRGNPGYVPEEIADEWDPIALNYTSGTTSAPKGVVYSHRGAYLSTLSLILGWEMGTEPVYLWSLPMFHCNGWTFTWGIAARGGTNVCIRNTTAREMYDAIEKHDVTHMSGAPVIFNILLEAKPHERRNITNPIRILTGGAPPPSTLLEKVEALGFRVAHAYGSTEATGAALVCEWQARWNKLPADDRASLKARQGVNVLAIADADAVSDLESMESVPRDGKTMGEILLRGSSIMKGYLKDEKATEKAFRNGWFVTGDVGVIHPDGYLEIKDRSKDVIISGGENISSVEVESVIYRHPFVAEASVVAMPHPKWGESPCAFVMLMKNNNDDVVGNVSEADIIAHCRKNLPAFMVPKKVKFMDKLPKTSTGKIQKFQLRALAKTFLMGTEKDDISSSLLHNSNRKVDDIIRGGGSDSNEPQQHFLASRL